jgi:ATP-dependent exoDNAse (exonuclease V) beta subunit
MPSPFAKKQWQALQEKNLEYVAITRAKVNLVYINSNDWAE